MEESFVVRVVIVGLASTMCIIVLAAARGATDGAPAVAAEAGTGPLRIAICAEYDALPDIGHACGHNIIAAAAVGAARSLRGFADELGIGIRLLGSPAEEVGDGGGKILMLKEGAWDDIALTMMVHPGPFNDLAPALIAISAFDVEFYGREAHATYFNHLGINAGAAATIAEVALGQMRQQLQGHERVHGIIDKFGSTANVLSGYARLKYMIRSRSVPELEELRSRVLRCFEAGAVATGASMQVIGGTAPYEPLLTDSGVAESFGKNLTEFSGREFPPIGSGPPTSAGSDMGNVSAVWPTNYPLLGLESFSILDHPTQVSSFFIVGRARQAAIYGAIGLAVDRVRLWPT